MHSKLCFSLLFSLTIPLISHSQVVITEIMYDLEGSDSGREWIEIVNLGGDSIDLSLWKLFEGETNHGLFFFQGVALLGPFGVVVIADSPDKFLTDWPGFSGTIYDSSFSLKNTGEQISIRDENLSDIDGVFYDTELGAAGDGNSLQKIDGVWQALFPTPGEFTFPTTESAEESAEESVEESVEETQTSEESSSSGGGTYTPIVNFPVGEISVKAIVEKTVLVGASSMFEAKGYGVKGEPLENARYLWNLGDGNYKEGERIMHHYNYPGEYIVFLNASSESFEASAKVYIEAKPSELRISGLDQKEGKFIKLTNFSPDEINISWWRLRAGEKFFSFSKNTFLLPEKEISFSSEITLLDSRKKPLQLLYPNGSLAYDYSKPEEKNMTKNPTVLPPQNNQNVTTFSNNSLPTDSLLAVASLADLSEGGPLDEEIIFGNNESSIFKWLLALLGLIAVSISLFLYLGKNGSAVDEFTIIE